MLKLDAQISKFFALDDVVNLLFVIVFTNGFTKIIKLEHSLQFTEIYRFSVPDFDKISKLAAYMEIYDDKKYKQERFIV